MFCLDISLNNIKNILAGACNVAVRHLSGGPKGQKGTVASAAWVER